MDNIGIIFENSLNTFYSGQHVSGFVCVNLLNATPVRAITLWVSGAADVRWEETVHQARQAHRRNISHHSNSQPFRHQNRTAIKVFSSREQYFEHKIVLLPASPTDPVYQPGEYKFPFSFNLPQNIPSSFEGHHGHVRYTTTTKLERPCSREMENKINFTVICPLDLNRFPHLTIQADASDVRTFWCLFCRSRPITVVLRLPESGIVPGQQMTPTIDVDNGSDVRINQVIVMLIMKIVYSAMGKKKVETKKVLQNCLGGVEAQTARTWFRGVFLQIPALPPSGLSNSTLVDISYKLKIIAEPERPHLKISVSLPIIVGTIPFQSHFDMFTAAPLVPPLGWNSLMPSAPGDANNASISEAYNDLPPPSYEESVRRGHFVSIASPENLESSASVPPESPPPEFSPRYPVYSPLPMPPEMVLKIN